MAHASLRRRLDVDDYAVAANIIICADGLFCETGLCLGFGESLVRAMNSSAKIDPLATSVGPVRALVSVPPTVPSMWPRLQPLSSISFRGPRTVLHASQRRGCVGPSSRVVSSLFLAWPRMGPFGPDAP